MSCYNSENYVAEAIESVLKQSCPVDEFIIINDGSTDRTIDILKYYEFEYNIIKLIDKQNTGLTDSLIIGVQKSTGNWIARIDADDIWPENKINEQVKLIADDVCLIGTSLQYFGQFSVSKKATVNINSGVQSISILTTRGAYFPHSSALFKKSAYYKVHGYSSLIKNAEDFDLWLKLSEVSKVVSAVNVFTKIRQHPAQKSFHDGGSQQLLSRCVSIFFHKNRSKFGYCYKQIDVDSAMYNINQRVFAYYVDICNRKYSFSILFTIYLILYTLRPSVFIAKIFK